MIVCTGVAPCPIGLKREHYDRESGRMECADCPGEVLDRPLRDFQTEPWFPAELRELL